MAESIETVVEKINKESKSQKFALVNLNKVLHSVPEQILANFINQLGLIEESVEGLSKISLMEFIYKILRETYNNNKQLQKEYSDVLDYIGYTLFSVPDIKFYFKLLYDFPSKRDMIDAFADWAADVGITVYETPSNEEHALDLYLTKKDPILKTEGVIAKTGSAIEDMDKNVLLGQLLRAADIADWTIFVTSAYGALEIGLDKFIAEMERLQAWSYIVDPQGKAIYGLTKGKKSKTKTKEGQDLYITTLPSQPIRAPSQVKTFSAYDFSEKDAYKSKDYRGFFINKEDVLPSTLPVSTGRPKNQDIFRILIAIDSQTGLSVYNYSSPIYKIDDLLVSGFLTAIDSFVSEISQAKKLQDINYEGFFITSVAGELLRVVLFLSEPATQSIKERLRVFLREFEKRFHEEIGRIRKTGRTTELDPERVHPLVRGFLEV